MKRYEMNIQGRELCERHGKLRCDECAYIAELEMQNERYEQAMQKAMDHFENDDHMGLMHELEKALKEDE